MPSLQMDRAPELIIAILSLSLSITFDLEWRLCSHMLETAECSADHTAINLVSSLEAAFSRWQLDVNKLSGATTDNARNIVLALESLDWPHQGCFAHALQLGVNKAMELPEIAKAIGRAKRMVTHFHHSVKSTNILRQ